MNWKGHVIPVLGPNPPAPAVLSPDSLSSAVLGQDSSAFGTTSGANLPPEAVLGSNPPPAAFYILPASSILIISQGMPGNCTSPFLTVQLGNVSIGQDCDWNDMMVLGHANCRQLGGEKERQPLSNRAENNELNRPGMGLNEIEVDKKRRRPDSQSLDDRVPVVTWKKVYIPSEGRQCLTRPDENARQSGFMTPRVEFMHVAEKENLPPSLTGRYNCENNSFTSVRSILRAPESGKVVMNEPGW